jgi:hypothetical protein
MDEHHSALESNPEELTSLSTQVARVLQPVPAPTEFRARLREGLTLAARHKEARTISIESRPAAWGWVVGAAALGSAAGLIAMMWRARHRQRAPSPAPSRTDRIE